MAESNFPIGDLQGQIKEFTGKISVGTNNAIASTAVPDGTFTTLETITNVESGKYILVVDCDFGTSTTGNKILLVDTSETSNNNATNSVLAQGRACLQKVRPFSLGPSDTVYIRAYQNSGSSQNVTGNWRLVRIA